MKLRNLFEAIKDDKTVLIYISVIVIIVIFGLMILIQGTPKVVNPVIQQPSTTPKVVTNTNQYYSELQVPDNFKITEDTLGSGRDYKIYNQKIVNQDGTMTINFQYTPVEPGSQFNTGAANVETPNTRLLGNMDYITEYEGQKLYRENYDIKYQSAYDESSAQTKYGEYLTLNRTVRFPIYKSTNDKTTPYIASITTPKNYQVSIVAEINFDITYPIFKQNIAELDKIIKNMKI